MKNQMLYFAYGSNMNLGQTDQRMPGAIHLGAAVLRNHVVVERMFADVEPCRGRDVYGVLFRIGPRELAALDRYEGFPTLYRRVWKTVHYRGDRVKAMLYEMTPQTRRDRDGVPYSDYYREACSEGARQHGIPDAFRE